MKVFNMVWKDFKIVLSDKKALAIMILMPVILTTILSMALKGAFTGPGEKDKMHIAVIKMYNQDQDEADFLRVLESGFLMQGMDTESLEKLAQSARELDVEKIFFTDFLGSTQINKMLTYRLTDENSGLRDLQEGKVAAVVVLPEHFTYDLKMNFLTPFRNKVEMRVVTHPDQRINGQIVHSIMTAFADTVSSMVIGKNVLIETAMEHDLGTEAIGGMEILVENVQDNLKEIKVDVEPLKIEGKRSVSSFDYYGAAMMTMFILFAAGHGGRLLLEEKQNTTYQRMVMAGTSKVAIMTGKFFAVFLLALTQITVMIAFSTLILNVHWGNMLFVTLISLCSAFAIAGAGILIAAAAFQAENDRMVNVFDTVVVQTMALLGGSFFPIELLPSFMQKLSIFSLNGISLKSYLRVMMGYGFDEIRYYLLLLLCVGTVFTLAAVRIFHWKGRGERCSVS